MVSGTCLEDNVWSCLIVSGACLVVSVHVKKGIKTFKNLKKIDSQKSCFFNPHHSKFQIRHDICQKIYTTRVFGTKILHKKCVYRDNAKFTTNQRKCFKIPLLLALVTKFHQ